MHSWCCMRLLCRKVLGNVINVVVENYSRTWWLQEL